MTQAELGALIGDYGLIIIAPLAVLEGPVLSVISGYLARLSMIGLPQVFGLLVLADLIGDVALYVLGRQGRIGVAVRWFGALGVTRKRVAWFIRAFRAKGGRILVLGKLTHSAGFAVLLAAGLVRMPFARFLALNFLATVPKVAVFVMIGWLFGEVADRVGNWLFGVSVAVILGLAAITALIFIKRRAAK